MRNIDTFPEENSRLVSNVSGSSETVLTDIENNSL